MWKKFMIHQSSVSAVQYLNLKMPILYCIILFLNSEQRRVQDSHTPELMNSIPNFHIYKPIRWIWLIRVCKVTEINHEVVRRAWVWMAGSGFSTLYKTAKDWMCAKKATDCLFLMLLHWGGKGNNVKKKKKKKNTTTSILEEYVWWGS